VTPHRVIARDVDGANVGMVVAHAVRNVAGTKFVLKKGDVIGDEHVEPLQALADRELHLLEGATDDVHEVEAGARLARAIAGTGIELRGPAESQYTLLSAHRGVLCVDAGALTAVNDLDGVSVLTRFDRQPVDAGEELAGAKVTPFFLPRATVERIERICRERPPLRVLPFQPMRVAALILERVDLRARDRFQAALEHKLAWFGAELVAVRDSHPGQPYVELIRSALEMGPDLIMAAGASSLDPLEPLFSALEQVDATIVKHGVPVHPGSLFWIAYIDRVPLFGLSSCEMFSHKTILDLLLPRLFAGETLGREDLVKLGHGGMLGREMAYRFPPYGEKRDGQGADG